MRIEPTGQTLGATITGVNLREPFSRENFAAVLRALGNHGVLCFPDQLLTPLELKAFSAQFGKLQVLKQTWFFEPGVPEVTVLTNIVKDGKPLGVADAGQTWHTDMTYSRTVGFVNVLVAHEVPMRDGKPLGATEFTNTQAAYDGLPDDIRSRLADATATHDVVKYRDWLATSKGRPRPPLTKEQRDALPPVQHPVFLTHPITGRKVIYVNPCFVVGIDGMSESESRDMLERIYEHVLKPEYRYTHHWTVGDVLVWDHIGTWHNAVADYGPDEHRLMKRCQVMADKVFDPAFIGAALAA